MTPEQLIQYYLERTAAFSALPPGYHYRNKEAFVLQHGQFFAPQPRPKGIRQGAAQRCFRNAYQLASRRDWRYVEGYSLIADSPMAIHHGWTLDDAGVVVDSTWPVPGVTYFGVVFPLDVVTQAVNRRGRGTDGFDNGGVLDDWRGKWPILRQPFSVDSTSAVKVQ